MLHWCSYLVQVVVLVVRILQCSKVWWEQSWHCGSHSPPLFQQLEVVWWIVLLHCGNLIDSLGTHSASEELVRCRSRTGIRAPDVYRLSRWYLQVRYVYFSSSSCFHGLFNSSYSNLSSTDDNSAGNLRAWCQARCWRSWWHFQRFQPAPH